MPKKKSASISIQLDFLFASFRTKKNRSKLLLESEGIILHILIFDGIFLAG